MVKTKQDFDWTLLIIFVENADVYVGIEIIQRQINFDRGIRKFAFIKVCILSYAFVKIKYQFKK